MENAPAKSQKQKAKERAAKADSYELKTQRPLSRNGWFAFAMCPISIIAAVVVVWVIAKFL